MIIVQPHGYEHSNVFLELGELIYFSLLDLGYEANFFFETLDWSAPDPNSILASNERVNIVLGFHLLSDVWIPLMAPSTIYINTEQLGATIWTDRILGFASCHEVWDYSPKNIDYLRQAGITQVKHLRLGYQRQLARIIKSPNQEIDVLFYGSVAPNDRRDVILHSLAERGLRVHRAFACYGSERDALIAKSKVVINIHNYDTHIFEAVRVFYLLINLIPVVAEVNPSTTIDELMLSGIYPATYDNLVGSCELLVGNEAERQKLAARNALGLFPQSIFTSMALK